MTIQQRVKETFNYLHQIPELGFEEVKTSAYLASKLKEFGYDVQEKLGVTGIVATLKGDESGPTVGLRADMDALAHQIDGQKVAIHSCGHDAHSSMVLAAAEELAKKGIKKGTLQILFQPAEELTTGALRMMDNGAGESLDMLFGIHLRPIHEAKLGQATPALHHAASTILKVIIEGKTAHGARPHLGINAINGAVAVIQAINAIYNDPMVASSVKATKIQGGGPAFNAIPASAEIVFDVRSMKNDVMKEMLDKIYQAVEHGAASVGAVGKVEVLGQVPAAEYDKEMIALAREAIVDILGHDGAIQELFTPGGEDFHYFKQKYPNLKVTYLGLGCDLIPGLHDPKMSFNIDALENGAKILVRVAEKALEL